MSELPIRLDGYVKTKKFRDSVVENRWAWPSATVMYHGMTTIHKTSTSVGNLWWIEKYVFDASGNPERQEGPFQGNWDDRETMDWVT